MLMGSTVPVLSLFIMLGWTMANSGGNPGGVGVNYVPLVWWVLVPRYGADSILNNSTENPPSKEGVDQFSTCNSQTCHGPFSGNYVVVLGPTVIWMGYAYKTRTIW